MNPIEAAVAPLKNDAVEKAYKYAEEVITRVLADLVAHDMDLQKAAPYPPGTMRRADYMKAKAKHNLYSALTQTDEADIRMQGLNRHRFGGPRIRQRCIEAESKFLDDAKRDAAAQYDAFVAKLVMKIGPVLNASLQGSHVWGYSFLTVEKLSTDGHGIGTVTERWKTQQIVNVSKLGKVFNQWPTRKVKT